ncbi:Sucrase/ferredoxin-like-domain-containing protein [Sparassis latifolia]
MFRHLSSSHTNLKRGLRFFGTASAQKQAIAGTVRPHWNYVLLHTHRPPSAFEPKPKSPLDRALAMRAREWGGLVNFSWSPEQRVSDAYAGLPGAAAEGEAEVYAATVWTADQRRLDVPEVSLRNLDAVEAQMRAHAPGQGPSGCAPDLHLYVCTHGARDCRCGETGARRGIADEVGVGCVGHVGGHKYAANVLVFPYGDWLGTVQAVDVPGILDEILERHGSAGSHEGQLPPLCPPFWRGRMGLDKDQQLALFSAQG